MSVRKAPAIVVALKGAGHFGVSRLCNKWQIICKSCSFLSYSLLWHVLIGICCALCLGPVVYGTPFCLQWNIMLWTSFISVLHLVLSLSVSPRHFAPSVFVFSDNEVVRNLYKEVMWQKNWFIVRLYTKQKQKPGHCPGFSLAAYHIYKVILCTWPRT